MALDFAPFGGITRIRFKGFALARVSASRLPCVWIGAEHKVRCGRVKLCGPEVRRSRVIKSKVLLLSVAKAAGSVG